MTKVVLRSSNLNVHGRRKEVNDLNFTDFTVPMMVFQLAHTVLFVQRNRVRILKHRFPRAR